MSIFDNVDTVTINNKEVKSIITSNGAVLYQKADEEYTGEIERYVEEFIVKIPSIDIGEYGVPTTSVYGIHIDELFNAEILEEYSLEALNNLFDGLTYDEFVGLVNNAEFTIVQIYSNDDMSVIPFDTPLSDLHQGVDIAPFVDSEVYYLFGIDENYDIGEYIFCPSTYRATDSTHIIASVKIIKH